MLEEIIAWHQATDCRTKPAGREGENYRPVQTSAVTGISEMTDTVQSQRWYFLIIHPAATWTTEQLSVEGVRHLLWNSSHFALDWKTAEAERHRELQQDWEGDRNTADEDKWTHGIDEHIRAERTPVCRDLHTASRSTAVVQTGHTPHDLWPDQQCSWALDFLPTDQGASWELEEAGASWNANMSTKPSMDETSINGYADSFTWNHPTRQQWCNWWADDCNTHLLPCNTNTHRHGRVDMDLH